MTTWHYSGNGNAMVIIDNRGLHISHSELEQIVPALCNRSAIALPPAEGVLAITSSSSLQLSADFFNPDGSFGAMCGNGGRTLLHWANDANLLPVGMPVILSVSGRTYSAWRDVFGVSSLVFPAPIEEKYFPRSSLSGIDVETWYVNVGSDHVVLYDVGEGRFDAVKLRSHPAFERGVNVSMVQVESRNELSLSTFERGVERITGACGTGALCAAVVSWRLGLVDTSVKLTPPSGIPLTVSIHQANDVIDKLELAGPTEVDSTPQFFDRSSLHYQSTDL